MAKAKVDYRQIKELSRQGLNCDQTAIKLGAKRRDILKAIREHFSRCPLPMRWD